MDDFNRYGRLNLCAIALSPNIFFVLQSLRSAPLRLFANTPGSHPGLFTFDPFRVGLEKRKPSKRLKTL